MMGLADSSESEYTSQAVYFLGKEQVSVEDKTENASDFKKALTGKLQLKSNQKKYYLNNNFNFNYDRNDPSLNITGTYQNHQKASIENLKISDNFDILRRRGDRFFIFHSDNEYVSKPQFLKVTKNDRASVSENIALSSFYSNNSLSYSFMIGKIRMDAPIRLLYRYKQMENETDALTNLLNTNKLRLDITPSFSRDINDFHISLSGTLFYQALSLGNQFHQFYGVNPRFSLSWILSSMLKMGASISYSNDLPDENLFYSGTIMNNYRNFTEGYIDFSTGNSARFSVNMEYKDIIKTLFTDFSVSFSSRQSKKIAGQRFEGDNILNYYYPGNTMTDLFIVSGSLSKGIESIKGTVSFFPSFVRNRSSMVRNSLTIPYSSNTYSFRGAINSKALSKCNLTYNISYAYNQRQMENRQYFSSNRLYESLKVSYFPLKSIQTSYKIDHYCNELSSNNYKNFIFSDISVSYLPGNRWEFIFAVHNIFNEKYYSYFIDNELSTFYASYKIRHRNILLSATYRF